MGQLDDSPTDGIRQRTTVHVDTAKLVDATLSCKHGGKRASHSQHLSFFLIGLGLPKLGKNQVLEQLKRQRQSGLGHEEQKKKRSSAWMEWSRPLESTDVF